jgi:hypothetical protein
VFGSTTKTVATAAVTAFLVANLTAGATPHPVPAPKHCSVQQCPPEPPLAARVKTLENQVFGLRAKMSCISHTAIMSPDINGAPHPLVKWRKQCVGLK